MYNKCFKKVKGRHLKRPVFYDLMINGNVIFPSAVVIKKSLVDQVGGFVEEKSMISVEDFDLWLKISRITQKFAYLPKVLGVYYASGGSISKASTEQLNRIEAVYARHIKFLTAEDQKQAKMYKSYILARTKQKIGLFKEALVLFKISSQSKNRKIRIRSIFWILYLSMRIR